MARAGIRHRTRLGLAWRPFPASSTVIRAVYGVCYNTSLYQQIAMQMAQHTPLSRSLSVANSAACAYQKVRTQLFSRRNVAT